jgi:hypothetical protein
MRQMPRSLAPGASGASVGQVDCLVRREIFSPEMQGYLHELEPRFDYILDYRDALAHRIPLYIAPYIVPHENAAAYGALEARLLATRDASEYQRLKEEQLKLGEFQPVMKHTLQDDTRLSATMLRLAMRPH